MQIFPFLQSFMYQEVIYGILVLCFCGFLSRAEQPYCSFFNNRAPGPQPTLNNCTWYRDNCCCMPQELKIIFARLKPMPGASPECIRYMNYLMCYICSPDQYKFYGREYLTVCVEFCNQWYVACRQSIMEGSVVGRLYANGRDFCEDRNFKVDIEVSLSPNYRQCFFFTGDGMSLPSGQSRASFNGLFIFASFVILLMWINQ